MTDRQQQRPLKKVQHMSNVNKSQLMEGVNFSMDNMVKVNKQQLVNNVRVQMSQSVHSLQKNGNDEDGQVFDGGEQGGIDESKLLYINKRQQLGINDDVEVQQEEQEQQQKQQEQSQQGQSQYKNQQQYKKQQSRMNQPYQQQLQQQVFRPVTQNQEEHQQQHHYQYNQPKPQNDHQQQPIHKKPLHQVQQPIPQQYNNIKYTYNQMQDEEIALSSCSLIVSQHNVIGAEEMIGGNKFVKGERYSAVRESLMRQGYSNDVRKSVQLEGIKSNTSIENKQLQEKQLKEKQQYQVVNHNESHVLPVEMRQQQQQEFKKPQPNTINLQNHTQLRQLQQQQIQRQQQLQLQQQRQQNLSQKDNQEYIANQPTQQQQQNSSQQSHHQSHLPNQQQQQQQQPPTHFDLQRYKNIQPILQQLLTQLKSLLKHVKLDTTNYNNNKNNRSNSKFFNGKNSRSQSKNKHYKNNNTLLDIMERRKQQYYVGSDNSNNGVKNNDSKHLHNLTHQQIVHREKEKIHVGIEGNKTKAVAYGLGSLGNSSHLQLIRNPHNRQVNSPDPLLSGDMSRVQDQQRQRLIINRNKINEILASSVSNFKKPQPQKNKLKSTSYINRRPQPFHAEEKIDRNCDKCFVIDSQSSHQQIPNNRKIIRSTNFSKLNNRQPQSIPQIPSSSGKNTIQNMKQKAFFQQKHMVEQALPSPITMLLKVVKKYLQVIAQGRIDDIESFLNSTGDTYSTLNELINRKKLFKTALYFERASIVAGVCYGYLMITEERGYLAYQMEQFSGNNNRPSVNKEQGSKQTIQTMKQQTKQVLKYMINLASFSLNNCKFIIKTIQDHLLSKLIPESITDSQPASKTKSKHSQHQLIQKQIYKRNIETIKLNIQYTQQTLHKLFAETLSMTQKLAIDEDFGESFKNVTKLIQKHTIQESFYTLLEYFSFYLCLVKRQRSIPFLAVAPNPYLDMPEKYTLVIDFISVFCYGTKKSKTFVFRPYSQHFLFEMAQYFDIVVICDSLPEQIDKIIDLLDTRGVIKHRLYKYHMVEEKITGRYTKSLQRIGRDMDKVVLLDVENNRIVEQTRNTIFITEWRGSKNDSVLAELCSVLLSIVVNRLDCSKATAKIETQMKINLANGIKHINFGLDLKENNRNQDNNIMIANETQGELIH